MSTYKQKQQYGDQITQNSNISNDNFGVRISISSRLE